MSDLVHVVCPACDAVNRIPDSRLTEGPRCGKCHAPLFTGQPLALTAANFQKHIERSDIPVVVDFWAPWCGPCKMMAPQYEQAARSLEPMMRLAKLDTEAHQAVGARYNIRSIPTLAIFKAGREVGRQAGAMGTNDIVRWVRSQT
jgi:thioredoxin 2